MTPENTTKTIQPKRWRPRRRTVVVIGSLIVIATLAINGVAFMQARSMTHFVNGGERSPLPEALTRWEKLHVLLTGVSIPRPENRSTPSDAGMKFEIVRFGGSDGRDLEGWYVPVQHPRGLCVQFHAYTTCKSTLLPLAAAFHELGYDVLMVDFRGSGGSAGNTTTIGYAEADDVAAAVAYAEHRWNARPLILYGQSMGGAAILRAIAEKDVHPSAVIIESTYDRLLATVENRFHAMGLPSFPLARLLVFWGGVDEGYDAFNLNPADYAMKVYCPVLEFQGGMDLRVTNAQGRNLFDHLAGPKRFELFDDCGHCGFLARGKTRWTAAVTQFLAGVRRE